MSKSQRISKCLIFDSVAEFYQLILSIIALFYPNQIHTDVPITKGSGRKINGVKKSTSSILAERKNVRNLILKENVEKEAFAPWIALLRRREARRRGESHSG